MNFLRLFRFDSQIYLSPDVFHKTCSDFLLWVALLLCSWPSFQWGLFSRGPLRSGVCTQQSRSAVYSLPCTGTQPEPVVLTAAAPFLPAAHSELACTENIHFTDVQLQIPLFRRQTLLEKDQILREESSHGQVELKFALCFLIGVVFAQQNVNTWKSLFNTYYLLLFVL